MSYSRVDLLQVGSTSPDTLQLFPLGKKNIVQKVIVGDNNGVVQSFTVKRGAVLNIFKTLPSQQKVSSVQMVGDKAYACIGQTVKAFSKKGKEVFKLETNTAEQITSMSVALPYIWLAGEYILTMYENANEETFYKSPDKIYRVLSVSFLGESKDALCACQDRYIRLIQGSECKLSVVVEGPVKTLKLLQPDDYSVIYGTETGVVGLIDILDYKKVNVGWKLMSNQPVSCITTGNLFATGTPDIIVGRDDGSVEVYTFQGDNPEPERAFVKVLNESITGMQTGFVINSEKKDIIVCTYSGKIVTFVNQDELKDQQYKTLKRLKSALDKQVNILLNTQTVIGVSSEHRIRDLRKEIASIEEKVAIAREKYLKLSEAIVPVQCKYHLKTKFILDASNAYYRFSVELDIPIEKVALHSNVPLDIIESDNSRAIISYSPVDPENGTYLMAIYRCIEVTNRLEMTIATSEGKCGTLQAIIIPKNEPKTCQIVSFPIKPLSLHERVHDVKLQDRVLNELRISGNFSLAEILGWIALCVDGIPEKVHQDEVEYKFQSSFQDTILIIKCRKGEAIFKSDNISVISIIKDVISKEAIERKTLIDVNFEIDDKALINVIKLLYPKLEQLRKLADNVKLIEPLKEITMQDENIDYLDPELKEILQNANKIQKEFKDQPRKLEFLYRIFTNLYLDKHKFKRTNVQHNVPKLLRLLQSNNCTLEKVISFFKQS